MKCPKCGFNSFEYHDACKKCAHDLTGYKQTYGIQAVVLPQEARESLAASPREMAETDQTPETSEAVTDMFSFDLPAEETTVPEAPPTTERNPFNFDEAPAPAASPSFFEAAPGEAEPSAKTTAEADPFAGLLESAGQGNDSVDAPAAPSAAPTDRAGEFELENFSWEEPSQAEQAAPAPSENPGQAPGEFDLENFSWEDTSATPAGTETTGNGADNPFGNTDGISKN